MKKILSLFLLFLSQFTNNNLIGTIPTEIGLLDQLLELTLISNPKLVGTIPTEIGQLRNINILYAFSFSFWFFKTLTIRTFFFKKNKKIIEIYKLLESLVISQLKLDCFDDLLNCKVFLLFLFFYYLTLSSIILLINFFPPVVFFKLKWLVQFQIKSVILVLLLMNYTCTQLLSLEPSQKVLENLLVLRICNFFFFFFTFYT